MARLDLGTLGAMMGNAAGGIMNTTFGVPESMLNMSEADLEGLPQSVLQEVLEFLIDAKNKADEIDKEVVKKYMLETGILEYDTEEGKFEYLTDNSRYGLDKNEGQIINNLKALAGVS
tara:strand:- start:389 stop:742 length:354 start_codon:yes stop_codon:yes gene_type:complete